MLVSALPLVADASISAAQQAPVIALNPEQSLQGGFVQERHLTGFAKPLRSEGRFLLRPDRGLIWRGERPFSAVTVITPDGLLQEVDGIESSRVPKVRLRFLDHLYAMLSGPLYGDWASIERTFSLTRSGDAQAWTIELRPRQGSDSVLPIETMVVSGGAFVDRVEIHKPGGDWESIIFHDRVVSTGPLSHEEERLFESAGE